MEVQHSSADICVVVKYNVIVHVTERIPFSYWRLRLGVSDMGYESTYGKNDCEECTLTCNSNRFIGINWNHLKVFLSL